MSKTKVAKLIDKLAEATEIRMNAHNNRLPHSADKWRKVITKIRAKLRKKGYPVEE